MSKVLRCPKCNQPLFFQEAEITKTLKYFKVTEAGIEEDVSEAYTICIDGNPNKIVCLNDECNVNSIPYEFTKDSKLKIYPLYTYNLRETVRAVCNANNISYEELAFRIDCDLYSLVDFINGERSLNNNEFNNLMEYIEPPVDFLNCWKKRYVADNHIEEN